MLRINPAAKKYLKITWSITQLAMRDRQRLQMTSSK